MPDHDPEVTPEQETRLRRLLAQARHTEPTPADVAARLDRVLAQLAAEEPHEESSSAPVDLAARRRRRARTLLVAAAAVVVVGVGVGQVVDLSSSESGDSATAAADAGVDGPAEDLLESGDSAGAAGSAEMAPDAAGPTPEGPEGAYDDALPDASLSEFGFDTRLPARPAPPVRLTESGFAAQAARFRERRGVRSTGRAVVPGESLSRSASFVCETADWGPGRLVPALYDGVPAVLAYRAVAGATQTVDLLRCGTGDVLRSIVLPVGG